MPASRSISSSLSAAVLVGTLLSATSTSAEAQLRPLDPTDFSALHNGSVRVQIGTGLYWQQHASLAGAKGRLLELGELRASWRSGRFMLEVSGTAQRFFREDTVIRAPAEGVAASTIERTRRDAGDYRVQTILRLTGDTVQTAVLRFGTRLPTTDNRVGLERDQTDFFAVLGGGRLFGAYRMSAEAGISINGTRLSDYEQSDVLIYAATIERPARVFSPFVSLVGQDDLHVRSVRGNEDLAELRAGIRIGHRRWVNAVLIHGLHDSSPHFGFSLHAGVSWGMH